MLKTEILYSIISDNILKILGCTFATKENIILTKINTLYGENCIATVIDFYIIYKVKIVFLNLLYHFNHVGFYHRKAIIQQIQLIETHYFS